MDGGYAATLPEWKITQKSGDYAYLMAEIRPRCRCGMEMRMADESCCPANTLPKGFCPASQPRCNSLRAEEAPRVPGKSLYNAQRSLLEVVCSWGYPSTTHVCLHSAAPAYCVAATQ